MYSMLGTGSPANSPSFQSSALPLKSSSGPTWPPPEADAVQPTLASPISLQSPPPKRPSMRAPVTVSRKSLDGPSKTRNTTPSTPIASAATTSLPPQTPSRRLSPSRPLNTRDELLISLMASEAVVDSRDYDILDAEQVDELKKEYQLLSSRTEALSKKLTLETKIRDAALSLSRVTNSQSQSRSRKAASTSSSTSASASPSSSSSASPDQLAAANARVERTQRELAKLTERKNEVNRMLMEHRAGVLSFSVRSLEKKVSVGGSGYSDDSGYESNRSTLLSPTTPAPSSSNNNVLNGLMSPKSRFDGAHLFAGHADTIVPKLKLSAEAAAASIASLETRLKEAQKALVAAGKKQAEMGRELALMKLEKQEVETMLGMELQSAEETIIQLKEDIDDSSQSTERGKAELEKEFEERLEEETRRLQTELEQEKQVIQAKMQDELDRQRREWDEREGAERQRFEQEKAEEVQKLRNDIEDLHAQFEEERRIWEDEKLEDLARLQEEMEQEQNRSRSQSELSESQSQAHAQLTEELEFGLQTLQQMVKTHGIVLFARDSSLQGLLNAISMHLDAVHKKLENYTKAESEWDTLRRKMEEDVRAGLDKREAMAKEIEDARKERDAALAAAAAATASLANASNSNAGKRDTITGNSTNTNAPTNFSATEEEVLSLLQPLWAILPSPEARAAKFGAGRSFRTGSPTPSTPLSTANANGNVITSLSDLDVRSLKALYNPSNTNHTRGVGDRGSTSSTVSSLMFNPASPVTPTSTATNSAPFSLPAFAARVQALINDDRALIERLIRFAQAHDLLKKNAERAQKLAQDGTHALETYQKQVRTLEERGQAAWTKVAALQEELHLVHDALERVTAEKHNLEAQAAEQAETCRQLTEANNTLSARTLTLAEEAAQAPTQVRRHFEVQMQEMQTKLQADLRDVQAKLEEAQKKEEETRKKLEAAQEEVDMMRNLEQSQRIALLDELNSMQTENGNLRAQLRAAKK
ncbi:hypothetical protein CPC08DRAFT_656557 [Agrocybe pediades]|nr:hypothetical protein CPC08DRAFT_656557 [Agrocybe pediades]